MKMEHKIGLFEFSNATPIYNAYQTRILRYEASALHRGLNLHKNVSAPDLDSLQAKLTMLGNDWDEKWKIKDEILRKREKDQDLQLQAEEDTKAAEEAIEEIQNILNHTLDIDDTLDWESLKNHKPFSKQHPQPEFEKKIDELTVPTEKEDIKYPLKPNKGSVKYLPSLSFFAKICPGIKRKRIKEAEDRFNADMANWEKECSEIEQKNAIKHKEFLASKENYNSQVSELKTELEKKTKAWEKAKHKYELEQENYNNKIDDWKERYFKGEETSIVEYVTQVLNDSEYPDSFPQTFELLYQPVNKTLIIEYQLPKLGDIPTVREYKYVKTKNEIKVTHFPETQTNALYDKALYEISIRTIHEIFESDSGNWIDAVAFNGWVRDIDKATGKEVNNCILTVFVKKETFLEINLGNIEAKICFKSLKGVSASKLNTMTPVQPIVTLVKDDPRFVESYKVIEKVDKGDNLAAMDWEDFEHLIRELFEKEFQSNGGEVKVTQASRDGGVDAIAFDPDPIRGGKIVIQAKRYSNTVGVSAVRDLYGTVMNEGATKGILVTTADYGPDAYDFANGKPLTLLNGANLLSLLEKHGHAARIDLQEAKAILKEKGEES
ncbi:MAG: restriction endonuclease [Ignavibacteriales bacterium]|nr:hypothetical protein [Ignavibacteriaceae bacterium]MCZ2143822.1 restriction endonuclease [Ignavibacteriales bacterium]WKZ72752.1 MAG: restriction endonuclease [Ignavibacteriaceae bacterium]